MLFQVVVQQTYLNQQIINRWTYRSTSTPAAVTLSFGLFKAFSGDDGTGTVIAAVRPLQSNALAYTSIEVRNLYSDTDFYATPYISGTNGQWEESTPAAPFEAAKFTSSRTSLAIRAGTKSFAGMVEQAYGTGGGWEGTTITKLNAIKTALGATLTYTDEGEDLTYTPVILKLKEYTTPSGKKAYKKWPTQAEQETNSTGAGVWSYAPRITTQNSRKIGRGA